MKNKKTKKKNAYFFQQYQASIKYSIELVLQGTNLYSHWIIPVMFVLGLVNMRLLAFELVASIKAWHQEPVSQRTDEHMIQFL